MPARQPPDEITPTLSGFTVQMPRRRRLEAAANLLGCSAFVWLPFLVVLPLKLVSEPLTRWLVGLSLPPVANVAVVLLLLTVWFLVVVYLTFTVPSRIFALEDRGWLALQGAQLIIERGGHRQRLPLSAVADITVSHRSVVLVTDDDQRHEVARGLREPARQWIADALRQKARQQGHASDIPQALWQVTMLSEEPPR